MKKSITILVLFFASSVQAQWKPNVQPFSKPSGKLFQINGDNKLKINIPLNLNKDSIIIIAPQKPTYIDKMPNILSSISQARKENLVFKGNIGNGFNIYESPIDKMKLLMPDSTNTAK
ncbi:MAG: hypothetical protein ACRC0I_02980 [Sediminibacterium sp.]|jgi:hypothetical protein|nr:hypothetical protein [Chitinophagaceae bacterium]